MSDIEVLRQIRRQLEHIMAFHGDDPEQLMFKLETLVIEWYGNGQNEIHVTCPHCDAIMTVYHMEWSAISCLQCNGYINQPFGQTDIEK